MLQCYKHWRIHSFRVDLCVLNIIYVYKWYIHLKYRNDIFVFGAAYNRSLQCGHTQKSAVYVYERETEIVGLVKQLFYRFAAASFIN